MNKIKENWSNIKRVLRVIQKIDRHYFHWVMVTHVINALVPCMLLYLSSYVLDGMADGKSFRQLIVTVSLILGGGSYFEFCGPVRCGIDVRCAEITYTICMNP